jgi:kynurenine formamidase
MQLLDLSAELKDGSLSYPGATSGIALERVGMDVPGATLSTLSRLDPHCGTHFDAPLHFCPGGHDVAETPLQLPEIVVLATRGPSIPPEVLDLSGSLQGKAVLFFTGWERHAGTPAFFDGYPSITPALADRLAAHKVALVGLDTPSVDAPGSDYPSHRILLSSGIPILEGLIHLSQLLPLLREGRKAHLAAFPLRIRHLEGSPVRAVALISLPAELARSVT